MWCTAWKNWWEHVHGAATTGACGSTCQSLETPTLPSTCTLLPNRDHQYHAMESLFLSPAKGHVTSSWAWSHVIPTSGKALLSVITLGYFTLSPGSPTSCSAGMCSSASGSVSPWAHRPFKSIGKYPLMGGEEWKLSGGSSCWSWVLCGKTEKLVLVMKAWFPPPQKPSPFLLEQSPDCIHEKNVFFHLWRQVLCPKTFTVSGGHLWERQWLLFPVKSTPKSSVTDFWL